MFIVTFIYFLQLYTGKQIHTEFQLLCSPELIYTKPNIPGFMYVCVTSTDAYIQKGTARALRYRRQMFIQLISGTNRSDTGACGDREGSSALTSDSELNLNVQIYALFKGKMT